MTTLVALATKDALVLGCDSLATRTKRVVNPLHLLQFFDLKDKGAKLKLDKDGKPLLKSFYDINDKTISIPSEHMTHVTKLFLLPPINAGVMIAGATSIGARTVKSVIEEFRSNKIKLIQSGDYSVEDIARQLTAYILRYYRKEKKDKRKWPGLEMILGGYGTKGALPEIYRITLPERKIKNALEGNPGIVFGGQMKEIQRIVFGTDYGNRLKLSKRHIDLLRKYRKGIIEILKKNNIQFEIPDFTKDQIEKLDIFEGDWELEGFEARWGDFSEQNAIECVDFFVMIMIQSQQFSSGMPTVGGEVHIALITKQKCQFISREEYVHADYRVPKHEK